MPSEVGRGRVHDASQRPADRLAMISNLAISALQEVSAKCGGRLVSPAKSPPPAWGGERRVRLGRLHRALAFLRCVQDWVSNALELLAEYGENILGAAPICLQRLKGLVAELVMLTGGRGKKRVLCKGSSISDCASGRRSWARGCCNRSAGC